MKNKKTEFKWFTVPEWKKEEEYLREQHQCGWKFVKVTFPGFYHFVKCEPEDVIYQLDYNQEGVSHKEEYIQMFQDCGWEYLLDYVGYSYFCKPVAEMKEEEEIFCDDESRMDMIQRVFKGRVIPLLIIFFCCIIPQLVMQYHGKGAMNEGLFYLFLVMFVLYFILFLQFGIQFWKMKKNLDK